MRSTVCGHAPCSRLAPRSGCLAHPGGWPRPRGRATASAPSTALAPSGPVAGRPWWKPCSRSGHRGRRRGKPHGEQVHGQNPAVRQAQGANRPWTLPTIRNCGRQHERSGPRTPVWPKSRAGLHGQVVQLREACPRRPRQDFRQATLAANQRVRNKCRGPRVRVVFSGGPTWWSARGRDRACGRSGPARAGGCSCTRPCRRPVRSMVTEEA